MGENQQRQAFIREYAKTGNATQSAIAAGYSPKTARAQGSRLLTAVDVQHGLKRLRAAAAKAANAKDQSAIADLVELQEGWTEIFRGERPEYEPSQRLKASELLGRTQGAFVEKVEHGLSISLEALVLASMPPKEGK